MISVVPAKPPLHQEAFENTSISSLYPLPACSILFCKKYILLKVNNSLPAKKSTTP